jgi:hypothetical protein
MSSRQKGNKLLVDSIQKCFKCWKNQLTSHRDETKKLLIAYGGQQLAAAAEECGPVQKKENRTKFPQSEQHRRLVLRSGGIFQSSCVGEPVLFKEENDNAALLVLHDPLRIWQSAEIRVFRSGRLHN